MGGQRLTLACTASTWRIAIDVNSGKPKTTPADVIASACQSRPRGSGARVAPTRLEDWLRQTVAV